jgi:transcriptional regulator with XRE-family HTH domain
MPDLPKKRTNLVVRKYLKDQRSKLNLTAMDVSLECELSHNYYQQLENGTRGEKLPVSTLIKISEVLGFNLCDIIKYERDYIEEAYA